MRRPIVDPRFSETLRELREARGLSLRALAGRALSSKSQIHEYETGLCTPDLATIRRLDDVLSAAGALVALVKQGAEQTEQAEQLALAFGPDSQEDVIEVLKRLHRLNQTVDPIIMRQLTVTVEDIVTRYEQFDHAEILPILLKTRRWVERLLDECNHPDQRRQLFRSGAVACGVLGYIAVGRSKFQLARAYCAEAFKARQGHSDWLLSRTSRSGGSGTPFVPRHYSPFRRPQ